MHLLVGLGNPGREHQGQRHNVGFMAADEFVRRHSFSPWRARFQGLVSEGEAGGHRVLALKPHTYMNLSGESVRAASVFYKIPPDRIIVLHDELDLAPHKIKIKQGGGHAGHNGLRSIMAHLPPDFWRVRIGIGHPGDKERVTHHVLSDYGKAEREALEPVLSALADALPILLSGDAGLCQTRIAEILTPPRPSKPRPEPENKSMKHGN